MKLQGDTFSAVVYTITDLLRQWGNLQYYVISFSICLHVFYAKPIRVENKNGKLQSM